MKARLNFDAARNYALSRLAAELPDDLFYHNLAHTRDDVMPAAAWLAAAEGVSGEDSILLLTAACYHDLGFVKCYHDNEPVAAAIARDTLPGFGYGEAEVKVVEGLILATAMPRAPETPLQAILADADLDVLGRPDHIERNAALRRELAAHGLVYDDVTWYEEQLAFLSAHRYFTAAAQRARAAGVQANFALLAALLRASVEAAGRRIP